MARSAATREMGSALSAIRQTDITTFETAVFGLLAEFHGFLQLKEEKVNSDIVERRFLHVVTRAQTIVQDWDYLRGVTPEQLQMTLDTKRQDAEKHSLYHPDETLYFHQEDAETFPGAVV